MCSNILSEIIAISAIILCVTLMIERWKLAKNDARKNQDPKSENELVETKPEEGIEKSKTKCCNIARKPLWTESRATDNFRRSIPEGKARDANMKESKQLRCTACYFYSSNCYSQGFRYLICTRYNKCFLKPPSAQYLNYVLLISKCFLARLSSITLQFSKS